MPTWPSQLGLYNFDSAAGPTTVEDFALTGVASAIGLYNFDSAAGPITVEDFALIGFASANGHSWTVAYTSCSSAGDKYSFR